MPAVKVGVGGDGSAGHFVKSNVFSVQVGCAGDHHRVPHPVGVLQRPGQRLHAAQAAAHHRGQGLNAHGVEQARLGIDPVFDRDHRKIGAVNLLRVRVDLHRSCRAEAGAEVVHADHKKSVGIDRFAGADHGVPPAFRLVLRLSGFVEVNAGHMV